MENQILQKEELLIQLSKYDKNTLIDVFEKLFIEYDESELSKEEQELIYKAREEHKKGDLVEWN
jgi:hypothetical protein